MKVVIDTCSCFCLSTEAFKDLIKLGMKTTKDEEGNPGVPIICDVMPSFYEYMINYAMVNKPSFRSDPRLVETVEKLGKKAGGGLTSTLKVVEIPGRNGFCDGVGALKRTRFPHLVNSSFHEIYT